MFYIFLDVDGVLNTEMDWKRPFTLNSKCISYFLEYMAYLNEKHNHEVGIVLTSSWKTGFNSDGNHAVYIKELIHAMAPEKIPILDKTEELDQLDRGRSVLNYCKPHNIKDYIVLDDDKSLFKTAPELNIYYTNASRGFTKEDVKKLINSDKSSWQRIMNLFGRK